MSGRDRPTHAVLVIGAGVVGMATARALQRAGCDVAVLDPNPPGAGCSSGDAGVIATEHLLPLARPATLARLPRMLTDRDSPLLLKMARVPALTGWFARFLWACRPEQVERGIAATAALTSRALASWQDALADASASALLRREGLYEVYDDATALDASAAGGFIVTPMVDHLRAAGTVEFALGEAEPDWRRAELLAWRAARDGGVRAPAHRAHHRSRHRRAGSRSGARGSAHGGLCAVRAGPIRRAAGLNDAPPIVRARPARQDALRSAQWPPNPPTGKARP